MSGPSLFDDFFSEEEQDDAQAQSDQGEYTPQRSITDIKQLLAKEYEEKKHGELSEEESPLTKKEQESAYSKEQEEDIVSNDEPEYILNESTAKMGIHIEWTPPIAVDVNQKEDLNSRFHIELPTNKQEEDTEENKEEQLISEVIEQEEENSATIKLADEKITKEIIQDGDDVQHLNVIELEEPEIKESLTETTQEISEELSAIDLELPPNTLTSEKHFDMLEAHIETPSIERSEEYNPSEESIEDEILPLEEEEIEEKAAAATPIKKSSIDAIAEKAFLETEIPAEATEFTIDEEIIAEIPTHISESELPAWELEDKYYPIGDVAKLFDVNLSHIRYWTNEFKLKPRTTRRGERLYTSKDIQKLRMIYFLVKEQKHTIEGARKHLQKNASGIADQVHLRTALLQFRDQLQRMVDGL